MEGAAAAAGGSAAASFDTSNFFVLEAAAAAGPVYSPAISPAENPPPKPGTSVTLTNTPAPGTKTVVARSKVDRGGGARTGAKFEVSAKCGISKTDAHGTTSYHCMCVAFPALPQARGAPFPEAPTPIPPAKLTVPVHACREPGCNKVFEVHSALHTHNGWHRRKEKQTDGTYDSQPHPNKVRHDTGDPQKPYRLTPLGRPAGPAAHDRRRRAGDHRGCVPVRGPRVHEALRE